MERQTKQKAAALLQARKEKKLWKKAAGAIAAVVTFCTVYTLILPALALSSEEVVCGLEEHTHVENCYESVYALRQTCEPELHVHTEACEDADGNLICGYADFVAHAHSEICYDAQGTMICTLEEHEPHVHTDACYESVLTCGLEESEGHTHSGACYELLCGQEENGEHIHDEDCYNYDNLVCEQEDSEGHAHTDACRTLTLTCEKEEIILHTHDENCYFQPEDEEQEKYLICGQAEVLEHVHTVECFETVAETVLACGLTEHSHTDECYTDEVEGQEETTAATEDTVPAEDTEREALCGKEAHTHTEECYGPEDGNGEKSLLCGKEAHTHGVACYLAVPEGGELVLACAREAHTHDDSCYTPAGDGGELVLTCGKEGHIHGAACYSVQGGIYTYAGEAVSVTVTLSDGSTLPLGAVLSAAPITDEDEYDALGSSVAGYLGESGRVIQSIYPFDIHFEDGEGQELALNGTALVQVTFAQPIQGAGGAWSVFHQADDGSIEELPALPAGCMVDNVPCVTGVTFGTKSFYSFVLADLSGIASLAVGDQVTDVDVTDLDGKSYYIGDSEGYAITANPGTAWAEYDYSAGVGISSLKCSAFQTECVKWTFEEVEDGKYYIRSGSQYFKLTASDVMGGYPANLIMCATKEAASVFTITLGTNGGVLVQEGSYYLAFSAHVDAFGVQYPGEVYLYTPKNYKTVEGVNHPSTVINLFDYWTTDRFAVDTAENHLESGINDGHPLKFLVKDDEEGIAAFNKNHGTDPYQGIVEKVLTKGYPKLSDSISPSTDDDEDDDKSSLSYLFDPDTEVKVDGVSYKQSYRNVKGLLQVDGDGYFYYNSQENFAEFDDAANSFTLYEVPGVTGSAGTSTGQFFPFNAMSDAARLNSADAKLNHYFGMTLSTRFMQQANGQTNGKNTVFEFSGDDDVWIFVDGVLVADLGGIHGAVSVHINFASGKVTINGGSDFDTTIKAAFVEADEVDKAIWYNDTFADGTTHTLDFFYLERGNNASNLSLSFNLAEVPTTSIYKVNQYGNPVSGAKFEVYTADENWQYNPAGPVYTGTTDKNGEMVFVKEYGMPYTLEELRKAFGEYFILRETSVPDGYRCVTDEIHLRIQNGVLLCENTYDSGVWASPTLLVSATPKLYLSNAKPYNGVYEVDYFSPGDDTSEGILFAVPLKYVGSSGLNIQSNWAPVYGDDTNGYTVLTGKTDLIAAALEAAKAQKSMGYDVEFSMSHTSNQMELEMTNLPGDITKYYYMLGENEKENTQYSIAYYWTSASSLSEANTENTYRVNADADTNKGYSGFGRTFGSTIQVPNLNNRMYVQKFNEDGQRVDGALFAMYEVVEKGNTIYYLDKNGTVEISLSADSDTAEVNGVEYTYTIDENSGDITVKGADGNEVYTISPVQVSMTSSNSTSLEGGTADFDHLVEGTYYIREISPPPGYQLNPTEVMVRVTTNAIYANAGTADDGVTVARGPGYVVSTLHQFASDGQIDKTLTWLYAKLRVNTEANNTFEFASHGEWPYTDEITYLKYAPQDGDDVLFNYALNDERASDLENNNPVISDEGTGTRRLYTDVGWSYLAIYQDSDYQTIAEDDGANYEVLGEKDIASLFSRSVFVQVTDDYIKTDLIIQKTGAEDKPLSDAGFVLYQKIGGVKTYYKYDIGSQATSWGECKEENLADVILKTATATGQISLHAIPGGTYYLEEITAPTGYAVLGGTIQFTVDEGKIQNVTWAASENHKNETVPCQLSEDGLTLTVSNSIATTAVTAQKKWEGSFGTNQTVTLKLYRAVDAGKAELVDSVTMPGSESGTSKDLSEGGTSTTKGWMAVWEDLPAYQLGTDGVKEYQWYIVEEPVNGYRTAYSGDIVKLAVGSETVFAAKATANNDGIISVTVTNTSDYILPATGGSGTAVYSAVGIAFLLVAGLWLAMREKRSRTN